MNKKTTLHLLSILGLLAAYAVAYGLDRWIAYTRNILSSQALPYPFLWSWSLGNILLAVCLFALYAWLFPRLDRWFIWAVVILGLLIDFLPIFYWLPPGIPGPLFLTVLTNRSFLVTLGALTAVAGIFTLFRKS